MAQASVLTDTEIRRVFRIIATTRHAGRNRLAFVLSIYAGLRIGEIAALTVSDVATANGDVRSEIKLGAHQTKGSKGRTVILSTRVLGDRGIPQEFAQACSCHATYLIATQQPSFHQCHAVDAVQGNLRDSGHPNVLTFGQTDFRDTLE